MDIVNPEKSTVKFSTDSRFMQSFADSFRKKKNHLIAIILFQGYKRERRI